MRSMSACRVHAMYTRHISGRTSRQCGHSLFPKPNFFFTSPFSPETTPEGGESEPKGKQPLGPRSIYFPPRWIGGPRQWKMERGFHLGGNSPQTPREVLRPYLFV